MAISTFNFFAVAGLAAIVGVTLIVVHLSLRRMRREVSELREELALWQKVAARRPLADAGLARPDGPELHPAEGGDRVVELPVLDEKKMRKRLQRGAHGNSGEAPERYRHVATLADRGLEPEEIAQMLQVSTAEAQQLVKLSEVARKKN